MLVEAHITIRATKAAVWAAVADIEGAADILSGVRKIEVVETPAAGRVGLRWKETRLLFGKPATVEKRVTAAVEGEHYTTRAEDGGFAFVTTTRIAGTDGHVTLTSSHDTRPQGLKARLMTLPMILFKGVIRKAIRQDLTDIKAAVERKAAA